MKIIVLVKVVPDTYGDRRLDLETGLAERAESEAVLDEIGERALELALSYADSHAGTEVVILSMAPESAAPTIRKGLAMGADSAVQVVDARLLGADLGLTAETLAAVVARSGFDLVIAGNISTDGAAGVVPAMIAELLGVPSVTNLNSVELSESAVSGVRVSDGATLRVTAPLPAIVSVTERLPDPRYPSMRGTMAAKRKPLETLSLDGLGIDPDAPDARRSIVIGLTERAGRQAGVKIVDTGDAGEQLAEFLIQNQLA